MRDDKNDRHDDRRRQDRPDEVHACMLRLKPGEPQTREHFAVVPLFMGAGTGPEYLTLGQAMGGGLLKVSEVSEGGSVPHLKVENLADRPVLMLDGEEVAGARQNRVLNTTILVRERAETIIPVSCTEQGRWHYDMPDFIDSRTVMAPSIRQKKTLGVSMSLRTREEPRSNQGEVWDEIDKLATRAGTESRTGAMRDIFEARRSQLEEFTSTIELRDNQIGLLAIIDGTVVGFDAVSSADAFAELYPKLLHSYAMEAVLTRSNRICATPYGLATEFIEAVMGTTVTVHDSVGYGTDHRYTGRQIVGSALVHDDHTVIHMAFFRSEAEQSSERMTGPSQRRRFRGR